jgi:hypothetical protein
VKLAISRAAFAAIAAPIALVLALAAAAPAEAAKPKVRMPDFSHLQAKAVETVDVDVGGILLSIARRVTRDEANTDPAIRLLHDIESVKVRSFTFDSDDAYSQADVDSVRNQLRGPEWSALAAIHKRNPREDVDVFICVEDGKTCGLAVISAEERELTFVNIVGNIDIDRLAELEGEFGIPRVSENQ